MAEAKCEGPDLLAAEIARRGITMAAAAEQIGVQKSTIHHYLKTRIYRPGEETRRRIADWSQGTVPEAAWMTDDELAQLEGDPGYPVTQ